MAIGTIIWDKSLLESLTEGEALLLGRYFYTNISPVLVIEVLANLKETPRSKILEAEQVVSLLAKKLPITSSNVNADYVRLCRTEIANIGIAETRIHMKGVTIASQKPKSVSSDDSKGLIYKESLEEQALGRWREGNYTELDSLMANQWKLIMKDLDVNTLATRLKKEFSNLPNFTDLLEVKTYVEKTLKFIDVNKPVLLLLIMLEELEANLEVKSRVIKKWHELIRGRAHSVLELLPYCSYILTADLFYKIALSNRLVESGKKSKSHIDLHYIYYLPFCNYFSSKDKFHRKVVPLFLRDDQQFIWGEDLKSDLSKFAIHIQGLSAEQRQKYNYQSYPPDLPESLICSLYDKRNKNWRDLAPKKIKKNAEKERELVAQLQKRIKESKETSETSEEAQWIVKEMRMTKEELMKHFDLTEEKAQEIFDSQKNLA